MDKLPLGYGLSAELDVNRVGAGVSRGVDDADRAVPVVNDSNVYFGVGAATDAARYVTNASVGGVDRDYALLTDGDRRADAI